MVKCSLRWSRWELGFVSSCHLTAAISALLADLLVVLEVATAGAVLVSYLFYLRERFHTFYERRHGSWQQAKPELIIGEQSVRLNWSGKLREMKLPRVVYLSEFLLVLSFRPEAEQDSSTAMHLVLWPDSLVPREERRLRRYLRFDLPDSQLAG